MIDGFVEAESIFDRLQQTPGPLATENVQLPFFNVTGT